MLWQVPSQPLNLSTWKKSECGTRMATRLAAALPASFAVSAAITELKQEEGVTLHALLWTLSLFPLSWDSRAAQEPSEKGRKAALDGWVEPS